jgi:hypothetical protein
MRANRLLVPLTGGLAIVFAMASAEAAKAAPAVDPANFFYEGEKDGVPASDETFVTHGTKKILGVDCTVVRDRAFENGVLVEETFDWYAQDVDGNVWYFGEDSKELDPSGNVISTEGSWEAGVNNAERGSSWRRIRESAIATAKNSPRA